MRQKLLFWISNGLIIIGIGFLIFPVVPAILKETQYWWWQVFLTRPNLNQIVVSDNEFRLIIPKINANSKVIANVDAFNDEVYIPFLKVGIAHAQNTALPGEIGNIYLFAHSSDSPWNISRYNAEFYLLNKLKTGDVILIYYKGFKYEYGVVNKKVVSGSDLSVFDQAKEQKLLTLQTCWPPGTTWKRLIVVAEQLQMGLP